ncbi:MAG: hypothetical protein CR986_04160 [Ignavibacteriae bacterium]|nr:MAG: hypothetical protein CR986_04160 [Ignavibacteriota bacterium]
MNNELVLTTIDQTKFDTYKNHTVSLFKKILNDNLYSFGIFLVIFLAVNYTSYAIGIRESFSIGINEVIVSSIGFLNVIFYKVYKNILSKIKVM